jgi:DNA-binding MarR family transcriptional regulator
MEQQYILTPTEADVLLAIRSNDEATIYEITTAVRLTPSEAMSVLTQLRDRNLVELVQDDRVARLTEQGRHVCLELERMVKRPYSSGQEAPVVIVSEEGAVSASRKAYEELQPEDLEVALDSELEKLEQEAGAG